MSSVGLSSAQALSAVALRDSGLGVDDIAARIGAEVPAVANYLGDVEAEVEAWPPPPTGREEVRRVAVRSEDGKRVLRVDGRVARLWGRHVVIDQDGRVHCSSCLAWLPPAELGGPRSPHAVWL